jgi:Zn-finger nucleic acid-binding protein
MNCPVCQRSSLLQSNLEEGLPCLSCSECGGSLIDAEAYAAWRQSAQGKSAADSTKDGTPTPMSLVSGEMSKLKFCPRCSHILIKYKIGLEFDFTIDRCGHCGGAWLDKNEWEILKSRKLHSQIYDMFSHEWQSEIRANEHRQAMENILRERLGNADYDEFQRVKTWLDNHPKADELYALLYGSRSSSATRARVR